ncbi:putative bifunctional diguanylate cyclase/phosphodiesterase [Vallicoccus soli]|uniref:EAL domain-containing protein n=1 Tax=Vallicoccus soli TaxID=2339232 RepID=A0A3A3ZEI6_9ACTN|nr:EAL domain-containing protein [Vallicoccus soli]RJK93429.1 EAL domain-containing protein [Vallicoccus soli]
MPRPAAEGGAPSLAPSRAVTLGLILLVVALLPAVVRTGTPWHEEHLVLGLLVLAGFVAAEAEQLHVEVRRHSFAFPLTELVLVVGFFLVPPWVLLVAGVLAMAGLALVRRGSVDKALLNAALLAAEVSVGVVIFNAVAGSLPARAEWGEAERLWGAAYLALVVVVLGAFAVVSLVVRLVQPPLALRQVVQASVPALVTGLFSGTLGLLVVLLISASPWSTVGLVLVVGVLVVAYRSYGRRLQEHKDLAELYQLTREVSTTFAQQGVLDPALLERVRHLLRAEVCQLWIADGGLLVVTAADRAPQHGTGGKDEVRRLVMEGQSVLTDTRSPSAALRAALAARRVREVLAVPLRVQGEVVGSLEVLDRQGERFHFVEGDRALLETLAVHLGVAQENTRLVGRLRHEAYHDPLTGLPNRRAFVERLDAALQGVGRDELLAVLVLDLQAFKDVNDTLGRAAGDALLVEVAHRVRESAPDPEAVARLSSDEIGLFTGVPDLEAAQAAAARMQAQLGTPVRIAGVEVEVGAVVGIAVHPDHGDDATTLLQRADAAMYAAKRTSRGVLAYLPVMEASSPRRLRLVTELRRAVEAGDLRVHYQPQVRLAGSELSGLEALVRWQHPEHGIVPPDEFIPVAEHTGVIGPLTQFVLQTALADLRDWGRRGHHFGMSVNISVRSLLDPGFVEEVGHALAASGVPAERLTLEITESSVMSDPERAVPVLERLRDMGVRLSVDDFGIGHSSLTYLRRLPVTEVKIDRSFVSTMVHSPEDLAIVRAVIDLSEPLGLTVVAEGVESEETRLELTRLGCGVIQGYLLSRPLAKVDLDRWLERRTVAGRPGSGPDRPLRVVSG